MFLSLFNFVPTFFVALHAFFLQNAEYTCICSTSQGLYLKVNLKINYRPHRLFYFELSWCCDRRSVGLSVLVSDIPLETMTRFFPLLFCRTIAFLFVLERSLWREDASAICSASCQWSESRRTHNHILLSHLRLVGSLSLYDSQGLRWKYFNPPPHINNYSIY
jgi:hypothetical protein